MKSAQVRNFAARMACFAMLIGLLCPNIDVQPVQAASTETSFGPGWIYVVTQEMEKKEATSYYYGALYAINSFTGEKFGPFLRDELNPLDAVTGKPTQSYVLDLAVTPDGKTLLITCYSRMLVYFVDVSSPLEPVYLGSVAISFLAEDVAISADGKYALVTGDGYTVDFASIDIANRVVKAKQQLSDPDPKTNEYVSAVAIAPDGTVVVADYPNHVIYSALMDSNGAVTYTGTYRLYVSPDGQVSDTLPAGLTSNQLDSAAMDSAAVHPDLSEKASTIHSAGDLDPAEVKWKPFHPVNVAISPDGKTVLAGDTNSYVDINTADHLDKQYIVGRWQITEPGKLEWVDAFNGLDYAMQSIAFTEDSEYAVMLGNASRSSDHAVAGGYVDHKNAVVILDLTPDAQGAYEPVRSVELAHVSSTQLFGVDGIVFYEGKIYASYPNTTGNSTDFPTRYVAVIDFETLAIENIEWGLFSNHIPLGMDVKPYIPFREFLPAVIRN